MSGWVDLKMGIFATIATGYVGMKDRQRIKMDEQGNMHSKRPIPMDAEGAGCGVNLG